MVHEIYNIAFRMKVSITFLWTGNEDFVPGTVVFSSYETAAQPNSVCKNLKCIAINHLHTAEISAATKDVTTKNNFGDTSHQIFTN